MPTSAKCLPLGKRYLPLQGLFKMGCLWNVPASAKCLPLEDGRPLQDGLPLRGACLCKMVNIVQGRQEPQDVHQSPSPTFEVLDQSVAKWAGSYRTAGPNFQVQQRKKKKSQPANFFQLPPTNPVCTPISSLLQLSLNSFSSHSVLSNIPK